MDWHVQKKSETCIQCSRTFLDNEDIFTALGFQKSELWRKDFCVSCWALQDKSTHSFFWKSIFKKKENKEAEKKDRKKIIEELFKEYLHSPDKQHRQYCYILALMLERKRIIAEKNKSLRSKHSGKKLIVYEQTKTNEVFVVEDPEIDLIEINQLQREVKELLDKKGITGI